MDRFTRPQSSIFERVNSTLQPFITQVYGWMTCGLLLTTFVAWYVSRTPEILQFIFSNKIILFSLVLIQLSLVFVFSNMLDKISGTFATSLFMFYSVLTGLTSASIFIVYTTSSIAGTFLVASGMFGFMTIYGYTTQFELDNFKNIFFMAIVGILLASLVNIWMKSNLLTWIITYIGVLVFSGLTAYDTQKLKNIGSQLCLEKNKDEFRKYTIIGALSLYLDFINIFLMLLRILGNRK